VYSNRVFMADKPYGEIVTRLLENERTSYEHDSACHFWRERIEPLSD